MFQLRRYQDRPITADGGKEKIKRFDGENVLMRGQKKKTNRIKKAGPVSLPPIRKPENTPRIK